MKVSFLARKRERERESAPGPVGPSSLSMAKFKIQAWGLWGRAVLVADQLMGDYCNACAIITGIEPSSEFTQSHTSPKVSNGYYIIDSMLTSS